MLMLTGCYTSQVVVKITEFDRCTDNTFNELSEMGYYPSGDASSSKSEMVVTGVYYSQRHGLQTSFGNETTNTNTYYFSDGDGNTVEFTLTSPSVRKDKYGDLYMSECSVNGCRTSKHQDYLNACNGVVNKNLGNIKREQTRVYDAMATTLCITGVATAVSVLLTILLLL